MPGNQRRKGAVRKNRKGPTVGSGGVRRRALEGRGPTPKAEDRPYHAAHARKKQADKGTRASGARRPGGARAGGGDGPGHVAGRNAVLEALREDVPATAVTLVGSIEMDERVREILRLAAARGLPVQETTRGDLDRLTDRAIHQGVALTIPPYRYAEVAELLQVAGDAFEPPLLVALDGVTDPRNLGAILRSADAFGAHGVIVPERRSVSMTASVWKVAAGAAGRVRVAQVTNLNRTLASLKQEGLFALGLDAEGEVTPRTAELSTDPVVLVVGAEGRGLSRLARETCDQIVSIPMSGRAESLNASVAASIALYEISMRRLEAGLA